MLAPRPTPRPTHSQQRRGWRERSPGVVVLLLTILVFAALTPVYQYMSALVPTALGTKLSQADRVVYYESRGDRGPHFRLQGAEREIVLVTHLILPDNHEFDPGREFQYGVHVELFDAQSEKLWERLVYTKSRQSKADFSQGMWRQENSFSIEPGVEITDERLIRVRLPAQVPVGATLHAYLENDVDGTRTGLVRAYNIVDRPSSEVRIREMALSPSERADLLGTLTYLDWHDLNPEQRNARVAKYWERLAAVGEEGRDYFTQAIYVTSYRSPRPADSISEGWRVAPRAPLAMNVVGPARIDLEARLSPDSPAPVDVPGELRVELIGATGRYNQRRHEVLVHEGMRSSLSLPPGLHTLALHSENQHVLVAKLQAHAPTVVHFGDDRHFEHMAPDGREALVPDQRRASMYPLAPSVAGDDQGLAQHLEFELDPEGELDARVLRVRVRPAKKSFETKRSEIALRYAFVDASGREMQSGHWSTQVAPEPFDQAELGDGSQTMALGANADFRIIAPLGAVKIRLSHQRGPEAPPLEIEAPDTLLVAAYAYMPREREGAVYAEPYEAPSLRGVRWRGAPLVSRSWYPILAREHAERRRAALTATVVSQVRLERREVSDEGARARDLPRWASLKPSGRVDRQRVLEAVPPPLRESVLERWPKSAYASIPPGTRESFRFDPPNHPRPPRIWYRTSGDVDRSLGGLATLNVADVEHSFRLVSTRGSWSLDSGGKGRKMLSSAATFPGLEMFIDRPPAPNSSLPLWWMRTLYRIGAEGFTLEVDKPADAPYTLNLRLYRQVSDDEDRAAPELRILIDGGNPKRVVGEPLESFTVADRIPRVDATPARELLFLDAKREGEYEVWSATVTLGNDLRAGPHRIRIASLTRAPMYLRLFAQGESDDSTEILQWSGRQTSSRPGVE